jgi:5-methylcytosine-specific restriction endonuclease McrA
LAFDLSVSFVRTTMASPCHYCGTACGSSELDKKVPTRGYAMSNVVPACRRCNTLKSNVITYEEMVTVVQVLGWRVTL